VVILGFSAAFSQARRGARSQRSLGTSAENRAHASTPSRAAAAARPRNRRRSRGDEKTSARVLSSEENRTEQNELKPKESGREPKNRAAGASFDDDDALPT
jgi:hypothetical protein